MPWIRTGNFVECSEVLWYALFLKRAKGYNRCAFRFSGEKLTLVCACSSNHSFASFDVLFMDWTRPRKFVVARLSFYIKRVFSIS